MAKSIRIKQNRFDELFETLKLKLKVEDAGRHPEDRLRNWVYYLHEFKDAVEREE